MYKIFYDTLIQTMLTFFIGLSVSFGFAMFIFHLIFWINRPAVWLELWSPEGVTNANRDKYEKDPNYCALVTIPLELTTFRLPVATMDAKVVLIDQKKNQMFTRDYLNDVDKNDDILGEGGRFYFEYSGKVTDVSKVLLDVTCRFRNGQSASGQAGFFMSIFQHTITIDMKRLPMEIMEYFKKGIVVREDNYRKAWLVRPPLFPWQKFQAREITKRAHMKGWGTVAWEREHTWEGWK